jgi:hypothetical protein
MIDKELNRMIGEMYKVSPYTKGYRNKTVFNEEKIGSPVYGEVTQTGTNSIVNKFKKYFNKDTVFYDLGSGLSKMVIHIGLEYDVKKSIGIEYSKERHKGAIYLKEKYADNSKNIDIICDNVLKVDLSDATVIYMDNTVFPHDVSEKIYNLLPKNTLILYKKQMSFLKELGVKEHEDQNLVERTYHQKKLLWTFKK